MLTRWLKEALTSSGMSGAELARRLTAQLGRSIDRAAIQKMSTGRRKISADELLAIAEITRFSAPDAETPNVTHVPLVDWVSAGAFDTTETTYWDNDAPALSVVDLPAGEWFALTVTGDSMDRLSPPGAKILINRQDRRLVSGACYIIMNELGEATYKRYRSDPARFEPFSTNPSHETIYNLLGVSVIGRVKLSLLEI